MEGNRRGIELHADVGLDGLSGDIGPAGIGCAVAFETDLIFVPRSGCIGTCGGNTGDFTQRGGDVGRHSFAAFDRVGLVATGTVD